MSGMRIPVEYLFTISLEGLHESELDFSGPFGRRIFQKATSGSVEGERFSGRVLPLQASDYGRANGDGSLRHFEADIGLEAHDGTTVLMHYRGRKSPRYGNGHFRFQATFDVETGTHGWLNDVQTIGLGQDEPNGPATLHVYALTGAEPFEASGSDDDWVHPRQRTSLPAEFIMTRKSAHVAEAKRHTIAGPLGSRYFTLAEGGGEFAGPRIAGEFLSGYSWSPHRISGDDATITPDTLWRFDVKTVLRERDGTPILMSYTGAGSKAYAAGSWMTATLFETPAGPHEWLNEVQAVGVGRWEGDGARYTVYALD